MSRRVVGTTLKISLIRPSQVTFGRLTSELVRKQNISNCRFPVKDSALSTKYKQTSESEYLITIACCRDFFFKKTKEHPKQEDINHLQRKKLLNNKRSSIISLA